MAKNCQSLQISTEMDSLLPHACSCYTFTFYLFEEKKCYNDFTLSLKKTSKCTLKGLSLLRGHSKVRGQTRGRGVREMSTTLIKPYQAKWSTKGERGQKSAKSCQ